jgi:hypothetical protein
MPALLIVGAYLVLAIFPAVIAVVAIVRTVRRRRRSRLDTIAHQLEGPYRRRGQRGKR